MHAVVVLGIALLFGLAGCDRNPEREGRERPRPSGPNVVLVSIDTLRADRVGAYGALASETPVLDALAARGARVENAFAPTPLTLPSHASLLTGLYPPAHGVRHNGIFRLEPELTTITERLHAAGYATGAMVGAVVLQSEFGLDQGFDVYGDTFEERRASATGFPERRAEEVFAEATEFLDQVDRPFFLFVHLYDPHAQYDPPEPWKSRFAERPYEGEVAYVDAMLGRFLEGLAARGHAERTVIAVTSDHGEALGEHGERTHSYTLYDATLRVPLVIAGPGVPEGVVVEGVVPTLALAPTLLELAGVPALPETDAPSLVAAIRGGAPPTRWAYAESLATQLDHGWAPLHAVRSEGHHYVRAPRPELYDVSEDPAQRVNLLAEGPSTGSAEALDGIIEQQLARARPLREAPLDPETRAQLQALGYALPADGAADTGLDPKDGLPLVDLYVATRTAFFQGRYAEAESLATELLGKNPASGQAEMLLSGILKNQGRVHDALPHAERAVELLPQSAGFQGELGDLRLTLGDVPGAVESYRAALAIDPDLAMAHAGAMWIAKTGGTLADAELHAERAVELRPEDAMLHRRIAENWERLGVVEQALEHYEQTLRFSPEDPVAHLGAAVQRVRLGEAQRAEAHLEAAGALATDANALNRLAIAHAGQGDLGRAESLWGALLEAHPEHLHARRNLVRLLRSQGREAEAVALEQGDRQGG